MVKLLTGIDLEFQPSCGSLILANELYEKLEGDGYEVHFIALAKKNGLKWSKLKNLHLLNLNKTGSEERNYNVYIQSLSNHVNAILKDVKPDLIHIHHLGFGLAEVFSSLSCEIPKITFCHGTGLLSYLEGETSSLTISKIIDVSDKIIFPTLEIFQLLSNNLEIDKFKHKIIPWGVNQSIKINKSKSNFKSKKLVYAGRINENKGLDVLLKAFVLLPDDYTLDIYGGGDEIKINKGFVNKEKLGLRVKFHGFVSREFLLSNLYNYSALIITTKKIEAFCLVGIEAQLARIPVLYSEINGLKEILGSSALPFVASNHISLKNELLKLFNDPQLYNSTILNGIKNSKKYSMTSFKNNILKLNKAVIYKN